MTTIKLLSEPNNVLFSFSVCFILFHFFQSEFSFTSCTQTFFFTFLSRAQKQQELLVFFPPFLSPSQAILYYLTAPLLFLDTSVWTRAQECWPSDRTLRQAATGWESVCLMGCGPMWSQESEFMSGSWRKRPSCRPPRCVWPVTLAEKQTHLMV